MSTTDKISPTPGSASPPVHKTGPLSPRQIRHPSFLNLWELVFALLVLSNIAALLFGSHTSLPLNLDTFLIPADAVLSGVILWLIMQRKRLARIILYSYTAVMLAVGITGDIIVSGFRFSLLYLVNHGRSVFVLACLYFIFSRRAREVLIEPFNTSGGRLHAANEWELYRLRDPLFWRDIALFFMVFAVVGHWLERFYEGIIRYTTGFYDPAAPLWQNYLEPFNIYGIGAVLCILLLFPLKQMLAYRLRNIWLVLVVVYVANSVVCAAVELGIGLLGNRPGADGKLAFWDYSDMPFNFMGQICLQNSLAFGLAATLLVWVLFPTIERLILACPKDVMNVAAVVIVILYSLLASFYFVELPLP